LAFLKIQSGITGLRSPEALLGKGTPRDRNFRDPNGFLGSLIDKFWVGWKVKRNEKEMLNALDSINLANLRARKLCRNGLMSVKRSSAIILRSSCIKSDQ